MAPQELHRLVKLERCFSRLILSISLCESGPDKYPTSIRIIMSFPQLLVHFPVVTRFLSPSPSPHLPDMKGPFCDAE